MKHRLLLIAIPYFALAIVCKAQERQVTRDEIKEVTSNLVCECGCGNKTVSVCGCGTADQVSKEVEKMLREGKTKDEILAKYVNAEGISVLAAPPKTGFNLTAWVLPFLGIFVAGIFLIVKARHWQKDIAKQEAVLEKESTRRQQSTSADPYRERLNDELERIE